MEQNVLVKENMIQKNQYYVICIQKEKGEPIKRVHKNIQMVSPVELARDL